VLVFLELRDFHNASGDGGAIRSSAGVQVSRCRFRDNAAELDGGAIFAAGSIYVEESVFIGGRAQQGGAIYSTSQGSFTL
jgi:predicted outer membrane repeat protein